MKVLITGAYGLIGSRILELAPKNWEIITLSNELKKEEFKNVFHVNADIKDFEKIEKAFFKYEPNWILHLAAYTNVDGAEREKNLAYEINCLGTKNIAALSKKVGAKLIFLSTDHVFDGRNGNFKEEDKTNPINYYGFTKLKGEEEVLKNAATYTILRISYPYRAKFEPKSDSFRFILKSLTTGKSLKLVSDQFITPTFIDDLALIIFSVIERNIFGLYHSAGNECLTFFDMGKLISKIFGLDEKLITETRLEMFLKESGRIAKQPKKSCLDSSNLRDKHNLEVRGISSVLPEIKREIVS